MATISIGYHPELTTERAFEAFERHFSGRYEVQRANVHARDFVIARSSSTGVGVRLRQRSDRTDFVFTGMIPGLWQRLGYGGLIAYVFLRPGWRALEAEVASFIESEPSFRNGRPEEMAA